MPNYEYQCKSCGHKAELFQSIKDQPIAECPECHNSTFQRGVGGGFGLQFKGSGFYITDYDSPNKPEASRNDSPSGCCPCGKNKESCSS